MVDLSSLDPHTNTGKSRRGRKSGQPNPDFSETAVWTAVGYHFISLSADLSHCRCTSLIYHVRPSLIEAESFRDNFNFFSFAAL